MHTALKQPAVYEDLFELPDNITGEIINGELHAVPRPAPKHALASSALGMRVGSDYHRGDSGGPGGWWILDEPEIHLEGNIVVPDLAGWRRERMPALPETAYFELPPDWLCEVLSPATARLDRVVKMPLYHQAGVEFLWLLDPDLQTLETFQRHEEHWLLLKAYQEGDTVSAPPFEALAFNLSSLWE